jgi:hypothetical protein
MKDGMIDYHTKRAMSIQKSLDENGFQKEKGKLMARVFLRATGAINNNNGTYTIQESDLMAWFENGDYLKQFTEYDTM